MPGGIYQGQWDQSDDGGAPAPIRPRGAPIASAPRAAPASAPHAVLVFFGLAGSGKDTAAAPWVEQGATRISFADPLKAFCMQVFQWPHDMLWGPSERRSDPCPHGRRRPDGEPLTPRYALQTLGTEWGRGCYTDVWLELGLRRIAEARTTGPVVVTDARFRNELDALRKIGATLIRIERPGIEALAHASEQDIMRYTPHVVLYNTGSIGDLRTAALRCGP